MAKLSRVCSRLLPAVVLATVGLVGCTVPSTTAGRSTPTAQVGSPSSAAASPTPLASTPAVQTSGVPRPDHVVVVIFENKAEDEVVDSTSAPYLTGLARAGASYDNAHGETHPSQPNYIALLSGSTHGVTSDGCPQRLGDAPNLAQQLRAAGDSFVGYSEALPSAGFTGCSAADGHYRRKHAPWTDFSNVPATSNQPFSAFPTNYAKLPTVAFVVPDICHDMHDCSVATGDTWARTNLSAYVAWAKTHNSLLMITFDEDDGTRANHIPTMLIGPMVQPGPVHQRIDHYSLLRTLEQLYGLAPLGAAATARPLACWR